MKRDFAARFTGSTFIAAASMLWLGWVLLPAHIGTFFEPDDFSAVRAHLWFWIWMYRVHIFGMVATVLALVALGSMVREADSRVVVWPGAALAAAGMIVGSVAAAFYYHFGAWGAIDMEGKSDDQLREFVESLRVSTEYVTCLVRFGRVFSGLGLSVLAVGLLRGKVLASWVGVSGAIIGLAAMGLTMLLPNNLALYMPVFHLLALWLAATGAVTLRSGVHDSGRQPTA